jgi:hypothetical protein
MVDVDDPIAICLDHGLIDDLHVPGENEEINPAFIAELADSQMMRRRVIGFDWNVVEPDIVVADEVSMVGMVGSDEHELGGGHLTDVPSAEEVGQTVAFFRREDGDASRSIRSAQGPGHVEIPGELVKIVS